jgi:GNAT superfamily N-acetyltransferase
VRTRAPEWTDAPAVLALLVARHTADIGLPLFRLEEVEDEWRAPDVQLSRDALLVEVDGALAGYAIVHRPGALAVVAPEHEGRGVGTLMLRWTQQRERERGQDAHRQIAASTNTRARELLESAGYRQVRSYWRMVCPLDRGVTPAAAPAGLRRPARGRARPPAPRDRHRAAHAGLRRLRGGRPGPGSARRGVRQPARPEGL